jgi:tetratricopeptide (TPR) repeat protein
MLRAVTDLPPSPESSSGPDDHPPAIPLGPFDLVKPIGEGGMGVVWRGEHRRQGVSVAVKAMTGQTTRDARYARAFRNEVRAVAGLDHPGIVQVYDFGAISDEADRLSHGRLKSGFPYLVMELVEGGSLRGRDVALTWPVLRAVLLSLLDALGHAHAHGVIHRDLKPENVLWGGGPWDVKLTDFGVAHALDMEEPDQRARPEGSMMGTPSYMAPEQIEGRWRDHGPWTDLYAIGCVAWELTTGLPPYGRGPVRRILSAHLTLPPPLLAPRFPVPRDFEPWLRRLLEKDHHRRFMRAADASAVLREMALAETDRAADAGGDAAEHSPVAFAATATIAPAPEVYDDLPGLGYLDLSTMPLPNTRAPMPPDWRSRESAADAVRLLDVGLGLYGIRAIPLVGRNDERDALWAALREVDAAGTARGIVLRGPTGYGKSRLAEWLSVRAHETGAATILRAIHGPTPGASHGIGPMLGRHLRCLGLTRSEALSRCETELRHLSIDDPDEAAGVVELLSPTSGQSKESTRRIRFRSPQEGYNLLRRLLEKQTAERPVILWLDDVQWGLASLNFAAHLLARPDRLPVLVVMTVRDEALSERVAEAEVLAALLQRPECRALEVGPLEAGARPALMQALLGLDDELAARVDERTAGNPLFAVQLVGDWVQRGILVPGPRGFTLRYGARADLPDNLHEVWSTRVGRLLEHQAAPAEAALLAAAVLGAEVDMAEWRAVCGLLATEASFALVEELLAQRLARCGPEGPEVRWAFQHGMLRETLERRARELGRLSEIHGACAHMLESVAGQHVAERRGRHLLAAGEPEAALEPLLQGARERIDAGDYGMAEALLIERERAMAELGVHEEDVRWGEGWLVFARLARLRGRYDDAGRWARRATLGARWEAWAPIRAQAFLEMGRLDEHQGSLDSAWKWLQRAERLARQRGDRSVLAQVRHVMGNILLTRGAHEVAERAYRMAREDYESARDEEGVGACSVGLGRLAKQAGRLDEAVEHFRDARARLDAVGVRLAVAVCENELGELARLRGDLEAAERHCREALQRNLAMGAGGAAFPRVNLGLILMARERGEEARRELLAALATFEQQGRRALMGAVHACLLPCCVMTGDLPAFDHHLTEGMAHLAETGLSDVDVARCADKAATLLVALGEPARARDSLALARAQWLALQRPDEAAECDRRVAALGKAPPA